ncbi:MAG: ferrous iron transport protein A [Candidatus Terraquivivens tikiterensis]|uniref:Ferrous iron transport protein A n=1 Tax=Candidatus Terraquivivens tikiterensis TaxID=1980982 RepID=A0A2R7Y184_9ARCH|nr:MAG: ferrous iron transport protein A [Candidatus Terraquivivens tikiterensis]
MVYKIPLAMLPENKEAVVVEVNGGMGLTRRLSEMGFTYGAKVRVLHSTPPGPILVIVRGSRIALGRGAAMKIIVSLEGNV